jgi:MoaA/NifB/PqqE/SkfB family radical SAM enzyme
MYESLSRVVERLAMWAQGGRAPPELVQIYPTNRCNLRCIFCCLRVQKFDLTNELSKERWLKLTEEICRMGVERLLISGGGEPLCVPEITLGIMAVAKSQGVRGRLINNGVLWTPHLIERTVRMGWDNVIFSLDGANAKTHDGLRGIVGCFERIITNIRLFNKFKKRLNSKWPILELNTVLCRANYREVPNLIRLAHSLSIKHVNLEPVCENNPEVKKIKLNVEEREEFLQAVLPEAEKLAESYGVATNFSRLKQLKYLERTGKLKKSILSGKLVADRPFLNSPCYEPWLWPKIEANGEMWPCSTVPLDASVRDRSFEEVWYGEVFDKFRRRIVERDLPDVCANCVSTHLPINREIRARLRRVWE